MKRVEQKNLTITVEQQDFLKANHGKMNNAMLAKMLGLTYNKTHNNLRLLGLVEPKKSTAKIVDFNTYFDAEKFFKQYRY